MVAIGEKLLEKRKRKQQLLWYSDQNKSLTIPGTPAFQFLRGCPSRPRKKKVPSSMLIYLIFIIPFRQYAPNFESPLTRQCGICPPLLFTKMLDENA